MDGPFPLPKDHKGSGILADGGLSSSVAKAELYAPSPSVFTKGESSCLGQLFTLCILG